MSTLLTIGDPGGVGSGTEEIWVFTKDIPLSLVATAKWSSQPTGNMVVGSGILMEFCCDDKVLDTIIGEDEVEPVMDLLFS